MQPGDRANEPTWPTWHATQLGTSNQPGHTFNLALVHQLGKSSKRAKLRPGKCSDRARGAMGTMSGQLKPTWRQPGDANMATWQPGRNNNLASPGRDQPGQGNGPKTQCLFTKSNMRRICGTSSAHTWPRLICSYWPSVFKTRHSR